MGKDSSTGRIVVMAQDRNSFGSLYKMRNLFMQVCSRECSRWLSSCLRKP